MSWLSNAVNSTFGWGGEDPRAVQQRQQAAANAAAAAEAERQRQAGLQAETQQAQAQGPTPEQQLEALRSGALSTYGSSFPSGFESTFAPGSLVDPVIGSTLASQKSSATDFINNMLKRKTLNATGGVRAMDTLASREPGARAKLQDIGNLLLEQERGRLRGIGGEALSGAQNLQLGQSFDPSPFVGRATSDVANFSAGLPGEFSSRAPGDLFDVGSLTSASGGAAAPANIQFDPQAVEGGQLRTGLEDQNQKAQKKRTTAVF
jgi:hypothetical protein